MQAPPPPGSRRHPGPSGPAPDPLGAGTDSRFRRAPTATVPDGQADHRGIGNLGRRPAEDPRRWHLGAATSFRVQAPGHRANHGAETHIPDHPGPAWDTPKTTRPRHQSPGSSRWNPGLLARSDPTRRTPRPGSGRARYPENPGATSPHSSWKALETEGWTCPVLPCVRDTCHLGQARDRHSRLHNRSLGSAPQGNRPRGHHWRMRVAHGTTRRRPGRHSSGRWISRTRPGCPFHGSGQAPGVSETTQNHRSSPPGPSSILRRMPRRGAFF